MSESGSKMKKKFFAGVGLLVVAGFGLAGCGENVVDSPNSPATDETATGVEVQKVDGLDSNTFYVVDKEVEEGKSVTCVVYYHRNGQAGQGGLSCNWDEYNKMSEKVDVE